MNFLDKTGLTLLWEYIQIAISKAVSFKVDKVEGKGLSTNDYTDGDKETLAILSNSVDNLSAKIEEVENTGVKTVNGNTPDENGDVTIPIVTSWDALMDKPIVDPTLSIEGAIADAKAVGDAVKNTAMSKDYISLIDQVSGITYLVGVRNGTLVTYIGVDHIEVITMPTTTEYVEGTTFDPTGMIITAICADETTREITEYTYPTNGLTDDITSVEITYTEAGIIHSVIIPITVRSFDPTVDLIDFEYTANDDGTYTLTGWKETLNGEASTEMIIPNNTLIVL